jgi:hypothetical protein
MSVTVLLLVLASQVVSSSLSQWSYANERMSSNLQARLAFDWLGRDMQSICTIADESEWLRITPQSVPGMNGHSMTGSKLMCYAQPAQPHKDPATPSVRISGPAAICYSLGFLDPMVKDGSRKRFALLRTSVNPRDTFENMAVGNLETDFWAEGVLGFTTVRPEDILADNIVGLRVVAEFADTSANPPVVRRSKPSETFTYGHGGQIKVGTTAYPDATLAAFEVTLWVLDGKSAIRMEQSGSPNLADRAVVFTKRIPVLAK